MSREEPQENVRHEPLVSETLERGAERARPEEGPAKRHGDALEDGSGTRHGEHERGGPDGRG